MAKKSVDKAIRNTHFTKEELQQWLAKRKKCCIFKSKKDYSRKNKDYETNED